MCASSSGSPRAIPREALELCRGELLEGVADEWALRRASATANG